MKNNDFHTFRDNPQGVSNITGSFSSEVSTPLDVKDLGILQDELIHEALAYKKWTVYQNSFTDTQLQQIARQTAQHHKQHFDSLQSYLNAHQ